MLGSSTAAGRVKQLARFDGAAANWQIFSIGGRPIFRGMFADNDPSKRLLMVVNYNTDISQFWEWSSFGVRSVSETNEAYKIGVNYVIYGLTH